MINKSIRALAGLAAVIFLSACSGYLRTQLLTTDAVHEGESILVIPLHNLSPFPEAGLITADLVATELRGYAGSQVRDKAWLENRAETLSISLPEMQDNASYAALARTVGVDLILTGILYEYGYQREFQAVSEHALVAMRLDLIRANDSRIVWTGTVVLGKGGDLMPGRPPLNAVAQRAVAKLLAALYHQLALAGGS